MRQSKTREMTMIGMFAALISVMGYISVPIPPVPITGQTLAVMLAGMVLSPAAAGMSVGVFMLLGAIGVPVFSNGRAGIEVILGPSGGYIVGFLVAAIVISLLKGNGRDIKRALLACVIGGFGVVYAIGLPWLAGILSLDMNSALAAGLYPFIIGDALKIVLAAYIGVRINKALGLVAQ